MAKQFMMKEENCKWEELKATTLTAAKREATRNQFYQGTTLTIAEVIEGDEMVEMAEKRPKDRMNMASKMKWYDYG